MTTDHYNSSDYSTETDCGNGISCNSDIQFALKATSALANYFRILSAKAGKSGKITRAACRYHTEIISDERREGHTGTKQDNKAVHFEFYPVLEFVICKAILRFVKVIYT
jgi:hypothetical protein